MEIRSLRVDERCERKKNNYQLSSAKRLSTYGAQELSIVNCQLSTNKMSTIQDKSRAFAIRMINCYRYLTEEKNEFVISKQILRSGTSIGANTRESKNAQSRMDFLSKLNIALKEADETEYWLDLLHATKYLDEKMYHSLNEDCTEIIKMLTAIIKTLKEK